MKCTNCKNEKELTVCSKCFKDMMFKYLYESSKGDAISRLRDELWKIQDSIKELTIEIKDLKINKLKVIKKK